MTSREEEDLRLQLQHLRSAIREIAHDVSNPLGVMRMAVYYLQNGRPDREKQEHYFAVIGETVEKVAEGLAKLRALSDAPPSDPTSTPGKDIPS
ncbi:MAG TPA: hypothetical protein VL126_01715 [Bacteroidota bacterium]|nr:hypothetical protein [Bacteroidota bacterium]